MLRLNNNSSSEDCDDNKTILEESFYGSSNKKNAFHVKLCTNGLRLTKHKDEKQKTHLIRIEHIIGVCCLNQSPSNSPCLCIGGFKNNSTKAENHRLSRDTNDAYLYIYTYTIKYRKNTKSYKERCTIALRFRSFDKYEQNLEEAKKWKNALTAIMYQNRDKIVNKFLVNRGYLIFLNPKSGKGKARDIFHKIVAPVLADSNIQFDLYITKSANFARQFVRTTNLQQWSAVVVLGGDGLFYEVINGVFERQDWEEIVNSINFGIIPAGSGNGLAKTISHLSGEPHDETPILSSSLSLINGTVSPMDVVRIETSDQIMFSSLACGWGFISDIDILSEKIRAIGYPRFTLWSLKNIVTLPKYTGKVSYLPVNYFEQNEQVFNMKSSLDIPSSIDDVGFDSETEILKTLTLQSKINNENEYRERLESWYSVNSKKTAYFSTTNSFYQSINDDIDSKNVCMYGPSSNLPSLISPVPDNWICIDGEFVMVHATYQTHLSNDCYFSPSSKLNDGIIWLMIIKGGVGRAELTSFLIGMSNGTHLPKKPNKNIEMVSCQAFRIEPSDNSGIITVDGENIKYGAVQGEIMPSLVKIIIPQQKCIPKEKQENS